MRKPMLAATVDSMDFVKLKFPVMASVKYDGIRCLVQPDDEGGFQAVSRTLKPIRNDYVRGILSRPEYAYMDGELIAGDPTATDAYSQASSSFMSIKGEPDFTFFVFDYLKNPGSKYEDRYAQLTHAVKKAPRATLVTHTEIRSVVELERFTESALLSGYEGVCLNGMHNANKEGRSTFREGALYKYKAWKQSEARILGFEERKSNENEAFINELGYQVRSKKKEGMTLTGTLGKFILQDIENPDWVFRCRGRISDELAQQIWDNQEEYKNNWFVTYRFLPYGMKDLPRMVVAVGLRHKDDMGE